METSTETLIVQTSEHTHPEKTEEIKHILEIGEETKVESEDSSEDNSGDENRDFFKMVILVRTDLNMGIGKIAAQVGHAVIGAYEESESENLEK